MKCSNRINVSSNAQQQTSFKFQEIWHFCLFFMKVASIFLLVRCFFAFCKWAFCYGCEVDVWCAEIETLTFVPPKTSINFDKWLERTAIFFLPWFATTTQIVSLNDWFPLHCTMSKKNHVERMKRKKTTTTQTSFARTRKR